MRVYVSTVNNSSLNFHRGKYSDPCAMVEHPEVVPVLERLIGQPWSRWRAMSHPFFDGRIFACWLSPHAREAYVTAGDLGGVNALMSICASYIFRKDGIYSNLRISLLRQTGRQKFCRAIWVIRMMFLSHRYLMVMLRIVFPGLPRPV